MKVAFKTNALKIELESKVTCDYSLYRLMDYK